jgi:hypothetical protein
MNKANFINSIITEENKEETFKICYCSSIINYVASDFEITFPKGFSIQYSASKPQNFAKPYQACNVQPKVDFEPKDKWTYDFSFVGDSRIPIRGRMLKYMGDYFFKHPNVKNFMVANKKQFGDYPEEEKLAMNEKNQYSYVMENSKFCLCPAGSGQTSIRFFEALAVNSIPIFIGSDKTKFPLDWIINWDMACVRLNLSDFTKGRYVGKIDRLLSMSVDEINKRREYINRIYNDYLLQNEENIGKFEDLVKKRIEDTFLSS